MPDRLYNYYRIEKAIGYLTENFSQQPDLHEVAEKVFMSPFHFQKVFTDWVGISPKKFLQYLTIDHLRHKIAETANMMEAAAMAGLSSQSRVNELFVKIEGVSPLQYKTGGKGLKIVYGYHPSPFGLCFIAVADKGICALKFIDEEQSRNEFDLFVQKWPFAVLEHKPSITQDYVKKIFNRNEPPGENLQLLVQGSPFQLKVWEALLTIPFGSVSSFQQVAHMIGQPAATRAVGAAVAANYILYLIPCHRIITKEGMMGDYHFGKARKQAMIGWEMAHTQSK